MKTFSYITGFFALISLFSSCSEDNLTGEWIGYSIEHSDSVFIHAEAQRCSLFLGENTYFFRGNTGLIEKGLYEHNGSVLILEDTLRSAAPKKIACRRNAQDTIELTMNKNGEQLKLFMKKSSGTKS